MKLKDKELWENFCEKNTDPYGSGVVKYALRWAELMESKIEAGEKLEDIAESTSHKADIEGITGFMYGCAVSTLSSCWEYGEDLRKWHNIKTQINNEGVEANANGMILNPAVISINNKGV